MQSLLYGAFGFPFWGVLSLRAIARFLALMPPEKKYHLSRKVLLSREALKARRVRSKSWHGGSPERNGLQLHENCRTEVAIPHDKHQGSLPRPKATVQEHKA